MSTTELLQSSSARLDEAWVHFDLGVAVVRLGRRVEAHVQLARALDLGHACNARAVQDAARAVDWYPYPFLNPANGGYLAVTGYVVAILVGVVLLSLLVVAVGNRASVSWQRAAAAGP
jgi:hypothetical protein